MKPKHPRLRSAVGVVSLPQFLSRSLGVSLVGVLVQAAQADDVWNNTNDGDWNNNANWTGTHGHNALISTGFGNGPTVTSTPGWNVNDLLVGAANAGSGQIDITGGTLSANYWTKIGDWSDSGLMNLSGSGSYVSGALDGNGNILVGLYNSTGTVNMNTTGSLTGSGLYIAPNNQAGSGNFNLTAGTLNISGDVQVGSDFWGAGTISAGHFTMTGGTANVGGIFDVGHLGLSTTTGTSDATLSGGVMNVENDMRIGFAGNTGTTARMTITDDAVVNVGSANTRWVILGQWDPTSVTMEVKNGGTLNLNAGTDIQFAINGNSGARLLDVDGGTINGTAAGGSFINLQNNTSAGTSTMNIKNGGLVAVDAIVGGAVSTLNFDNGTLKATANDPNLINLGSGSVNILAGGATVDSNGHNATVVSGLLDGGGGGGLTKTGAGTLTLAGNSTYTGDTMVSAGTLLVSGALGNTDVTVEGGATIGGPGSIDGSLHFAAGAMLDTTVGTLDLGSALVSFSGFDFGDLTGFDVFTAANGVYTFMTGTNFDFTNVANFEVGNALDLGGGRSAYFQNGSLQVVVIPEPGAALLGGIGMLALLRRRRSC